MATRLLCHTLVQQLRVAQQQATRIWSRSSLPYTTRSHHRTWYTNHQRALHVRTSDQDAGLQAKREANRADRQQLDDVLLDTDVVSKQKPRSSRRSNVKEDLKQTASDSALAGKTVERVPNIQTTKKHDFIPDGDADVFGNASTAEDTIDEGDIEEEEYISRPMINRHVKKQRTREYASLIKEHLNAKRLKEAIDVLEVRMLKEDRVKPENYIYNLLISGCAKAGYTRKAFSLYTKMQQRGLKVTGGTYTSLFNACANAPTSVDGLAKAHHLREIMLEKGYEPNVKNYNVMIKTYGRCGDVKTAYLLADEMLEKKLSFTAETYNFLLQACASDVKYGFRHSLLTWHKMLKSGFNPDYYSFNTLLRCVRDCGFGDLETMQQVLQQIAPATEADQVKQLTQGQNAAFAEKNMPTTPSIDTTTVDDETQNPFKAEIVEAKTEELNELQLPNLLLPRPHLGSLVALSEVTQAHERFLLLGGITGFLELMKSYKITPDIETFTMMLEVIPPTNAAEKQLLTFVRKIGLKADIDFFNILIKKRSMRFDYISAREVLTMVRTAGLQPDIVTYGVLSLGCQTQEQARELLQHMRAAGVRMNIQILGAMLRQGCAQKSFDYVNEIMQISLDENIRPNEIFLRHLHNFHKQNARAIDARHFSTKGRSYKKGHAKFCDKYRLYYEEHGLTGLKLEDAIKRVQERPYQQYKNERIDGLEPLKSEELARKQKMRKYIKKIKIENLSNGPETEVKTQPKQIE